jgi:hypothetical protein
MNRVDALPTSSVAAIPSLTPAHPEWRDRVAETCFTLASILTDPACKVREYFRRITVVDTLHPTDSKMANLARKLSLTFSMGGYAGLAVVTTPPSFVLRALATHLEREPFLSLTTGEEGKTLPPDTSFSLYSWNVCCIGGGYSITDGGVVPSPERIDEIIEKIIRQDADVNCLYEVFDIQTAHRIAEKLKNHGYSEFYFNIGKPTMYGLTSGILVASKYKIQKPEFTAFPKDMLVGRTKNVAKGVFAFDLDSQGHSFARIHATHLQHSEQPISPTKDELAARKRQMELIVEKIKTVRDRSIVVTGDLNLDDREYQSSSWNSLFQKGDRYQGFTWGGDAFCARLVGKPVSGPLNLDHTMIVSGTAQAISTSLVDTGYNPEVFTQEALSDHLGLFSTITVERPETSLLGPR